MKGYIAATNNIRTFVRERTVPWKENGDRGLMRQMYMSFVEGFHDLERLWHNEVDHFIEHVYPSEVAKAEFRLVDAFKRDDYPHLNDLRSRFKLTLDLDAVAESEDFRVKLDDNTVASIQEQIKDATERRVHGVMVDVWERMATMVEHYVTRTGPDIERFHETTVTNLMDLIGLLPGLNLIGDPNLKEMGARLKQTLGGYDVKDLRKSLDTRAAARAEAQEILDSMRGFMSAMGN